jgi:hypothetical protein
MANLVEPNTLNYRHLVSISGISVMRSIAKNMGFPRKALAVLRPKDGLWRRSQSEPFRGCYLARLPTFTSTVLALAASSRTLTAILVSHLTC